MKLKRTSRRLVRRIALGLAVVAVAAPTAGAHPLLTAGYNDNAVKTAALAHAYKVWNSDRVSNGGDEVSSALADFYRVLPSALAGGQVTAGVGNGYVSVPSGGSATGFFGPIGQVPTESTVVTAPEFPRFGLPSPAEHPIVTTPESPLGPGRAPLPVADSGEGFTWDDATIGIVAGLGTALVAALAGIAVMGRRDRLARA
jgi:hypothetical protein